MGKEYNRYFTRKPRKRGRGTAEISNLSSDQGNGAQDPAHVETGKYF